MVIARFVYVAVEVLTDRKEPAYKKVRFIFSERWYLFNSYNFDVASVKRSRYE